MVGLLIIHNLSGIKVHALACVVVVMNGDDASACIVEAYVFSATAVNFCILSCCLIIIYHTAVFEQIYYRYIYKFMN